MLREARFEVACPPAAKPRAAAPMMSARRTAPTPPLRHLRFHTTDSLRKKQGQCRECAATDEVRESGRRWPNACTGMQESQTLLASGALVSGHGDSACVLLMRATCGRGRRRPRQDLD